MGITRYIYARDSFTLLTFIFLEKEDLQLLGLHLIKVLEKFTQ